MSKKECKLVITEEKDRSITTHLKNKGFSALELLGILDMKRQDIMEQLYRPGSFKYVREYEADDGTVVRKIHESEEEAMTGLISDPVQNAYKTLEPILGKKRVTKSELLVALEEAIGYLGEALE